MGHKSGEKVGVSYCHGLGGNQVFAYTKRQQIMSDDNCLDASSSNGPVNLVRCHGMGGNQEWSYDENVSFSTIRLNIDLSCACLIILKSIYFIGFIDKTCEFRKLPNTTNS